jgi:hypothetical protein
MTVDSSRRRYRRLKANGTVLWRRAGQTDESPHESKVRDISLKGMSLIADEELEVEMPLLFELNVEGREDPPVKGEAIVAWSARAGASNGNMLVGAQFSTVNPAELLGLLLEWYPNNPEVHASLCSEVQFCSDTEKQHCQAYQQAKNCWEFERLECCYKPRSECSDCPYAALAFLL